MAQLGEAIETGLKKDIKDEKTKLLKIFKKHPFVKTIISNR